MKKTLLALAVVVGLLAVVPALAAAPAANVPASSAPSSMMPGGQLPNGNWVYTMQRPGVAFHYPQVLARHSRGLAVWACIASTITLLLVWALLVVLILGLWKWVKKMDKKE